MIFSRKSGKNIVTGASHRASDLVQSTKMCELLGLNIEDSKMAISYKKLWHILIDLNMKKKDLERLAGVSEHTTKS